MKYMLDANICIYIINQKPPSVLKRFSTMDLSTLSVSVVVAAELAYCVSKSQRFQLNKAVLERFLDVLHVEDMPASAMWHYVQTRRALESKGQRIGENDLWIASHALATQATLITHNTREFELVEGLKTENWAV